MRRRRRDQAVRPSPHSPPGAAPQRHRACSHHVRHVEAGALSPSLPRHEGLLRFRQPMPSPHRNPKVCSTTLRVGSAVCVQRLQLVPGHSDARTTVHLLLRTSVSVPNDHVPARVRHRSYQRRSRELWPPGLSTAWSQPDGTLTMENSRDEVPRWKRSLPRRPAHRWTVSWRCSSSSRWRSCGRKAMWRQRPSPVRGCVLWRMWAR